jgi:hypothetical protein
LQNDVEAVSVIPALRLVDATVETLKWSSGRRVLREREQRNEQRCEGRNANCHGFVKESTGYWRGASVNFPARRGRKKIIPLPKCRMIRHNSRRRSKSLDAIRRVSLESGKRSSLSRRRRKSNECGLAAMEFRPKVDYENIKLRFT